MLARIGLLNPQGHSGLRRSNDKSFLVYDRILAAVVRKLCVSMHDSDKRDSKPIVLVVEDDYWQRFHAVDLIEHAGYDVLEAHSADEAIKLLEARKDIRIVFTDINMPGSMDGLKLARAIRERWPPIELIIASGKHRLDADQIPERGRFLPKPYDADALLGAIQTLAKT
jgi:CheY-like chemotaxis protein